MSHATGDLLMLMDSDPENDPKDIPLLMAEPDEGFDAVSGWRHLNCRPCEDHAQLHLHYATVRTVRFVFQDSCSEN